jgi:hypothetical protein
MLSGKSRRQPAVHRGSAAPRDRRQASEIRSHPVAS